jgi:IS4 transposase
MAAVQPTSPEAFLLDLFPPGTIRRAGRRLGCYLRVRKIDVLALVLVVVLTVCGRGEQPIAEMRRELERRTGVFVVRSSFWARLSPEFGSLVRWLLDSVVKRSWDDVPQLPGFLEGFTDLIAGDATVVQVHKSLSAKWKGTGSDAAIKVHTLVRALTGELLRYRITEETRPECRVFGAGHWARGALFLLDRGYSAAALWWRIHRLGGFFVTRLKKNFHAVVVEVNPGHRGSRTKPVGKKIWDVLKGRRGGRIDVMCRFTVKVRPYRRLRGRRFEHFFRVVAVWNGVERRYQLYVTNVAPSRFTAEQVAASYRLRWEVERFYVCAKSGMGLDKVTSKKAHVVELLVRAALLRATVAMQAKCIADQHLPRHRWTNGLLWMKVWRERTAELLVGWLGGHEPHRQTTWARLARLAMDPNRNRLSPRVVAQLGVALEWAWHRHSSRSSA